MGRKPKTIYEYFNAYPEYLVDNVIASLSPAERDFIKKRYGEDMHNTDAIMPLNKDDSIKMYNLLKKIGKLVAKKYATITVAMAEEESIEELLEDNSEVVIPQLTILNLLKNGKTNKEICEQLNITPQELSAEILKLKNLGTSFLREYYSNGSIKYQKVSNMPSLKEFFQSSYQQEKTIITDNNENSLRVLVISDLHMGNTLERMDSLNQVFDYCVKNNIHIILCGGDIIDGAFTQGSQRISDLYEQIEYFIENYPHDPSILTFSVAGDHDMSALDRSGINIIDACNNYRHDFVIGGFNNALVNIKNDKIHLFHRIDSGKFQYNGAPLVLHGHSHKYATSYFNGTLNVTIPTLSDLTDLVPSALELNISFNKGYMANLVIKHIFFGKSSKILSEATFDLSKRRSINFEPAQNTETYRTDLPVNSEPTLKRDNSRLSQIEKFNLRYGKKQ